MNQTSHFVGGFHVSQNKKNGLFFSIRQAFDDKPAVRVGAAIPLNDDGINQRVQASSTSAQFKK
jgi:hypothetical protein